MLMDKLLVAFNKTDLLRDDPNKKAQNLKKLGMQLSKTKFGPNLKIAEVNAVPASEKEADIQESRESVLNFVNMILDQVEVPDRQAGTSKDFMFAIDHCFQIKGQGTVVTGTCLAGQVKVGDTIEFPLLGQEKKIRSMQMFKKPVQSIKQGDRAGICVP